PVEEMAQVMNGLPAEMVCRLTRHVWPCVVEENVSQPMLAQIRAMDERDARREASAKRQAGGSPSTNGGFRDGDPGDWLRRLVSDAMAASAGKGRSQTGKTVGGMRGGNLMTRASELLA